MNIHLTKEEFETHIEQQDKMFKDWRKFWAYKPTGKNQYDYVEIKTNDNKSKKQTHA